MADVIAEHIVEQYESPWKEASDTLFGPEHAIEVWQRIESEELLPPPSQHLVIVSAASHIPTHERALFTHIAETRPGGCTFFAEDIQNPKHWSATDQAVATPIHTPTSDFQFIQSDARNIPVARGSVDVLFDRKGWIWHASNVNTLNTKRVFTAFEHYYQLLKPGGILVVDAISGFREYLEQLTEEQQNRILASIGKNMDPREVYENPPGQFEPSTVEMLDIYTPRIWARIEPLYEMHDIGEGQLRVRVLTKRTSSGQL